jgi:3D (Asp-Asp-Asp) domain-containing protein
MFCKYYSKCKLYSPSSYTCTKKGGGDHCGIWREFNEIKKVKWKMFYQYIVKNNLKICWHFRKDILYGILAILIGAIIGYMFWCVSSQEDEQRIDLWTASEHHHEHIVRIERPVYSVIKTFQNITCYTWTGNKMANGIYPTKGYVANNQYSFGTKVEILGNIYIVGDRIGHSSDWDLYFDSYENCIKFGRKITNVKIL